MLTNQKENFSLDPQITYLNGAYMSPQLNVVEEVGIAALKRKSQPYAIKQDDFFTDTLRLKKAFANLIVARPLDCSIIPSVSYGMATVAKNLPLSPTKNQIIVVGEQFPSNVYAWLGLEKEGKAKVHIVSPPQDRNPETWNAEVLAAITDQTAMVAIGHIHWADGTLFDLKKIRAKSREHQAWMVIDGTQSVGALPFSVKEFEPEALICAGYKWLMGSYGLGMAYFHPSLHEGKPLEENWINRQDSEDFSGLVQYRESYQPGAGRYDMGEKSNFILVPMLARAIEQILEWGVENIQDYCVRINAKAKTDLRDAGYQLIADQYTTGHLWSVRFEDATQMQAVANQLKEANIFVSFRGLAARVAPHVYNDEADLEKLTSILLGSK
jgi:selenocysteine lyase/cysteine desulfurase